MNPDEFLVFKPTLSTTRPILEKVSKDWVDNQQLNLILERIGGKIDGKIA